MYRPMQRELIETDRKEVSCEGSGGPLGHPRVYLHIVSEEGEVTCPYCSRTFRLRQKMPKHAAH